MKKLAFVALLALSASPALAQSNPGQPTTDEKGDVIVVTASRSGDAVPVNQLGASVTVLNAGIPLLEGDVAGFVEQMRPFAALGVDTVILRPPTTGESSAQVVAQQSLDGIPISPGGLVTMLIGSDGEIRAIDSSIYPKTEIANKVSLAQPPQSREILFVTQSAPTAVLRHAYETRDRGIQTVTDAQTGEVLLERNRQIH